MPDKFGNWLPQELFAAGIPQLQPKPDQNALAQPGVGLPIGWGTAAGMAGGIVGTAVGNPLVQSAMNMPQQMSDLGHGIPMTANSAGTGVDPYIGKVVDVTGMLAGAGMPMAEAGAAGIFGGRLAQTANIDALNTATTMAAKGAAKEDILKQTGWFQGADKRWRFEIPDKPSQLNEAAVDTLMGPTGGQGSWTGPASGILNHPELYAAYPELANMGVELQCHSQLPYGTIEGRYNAAAETPIQGMSHDIFNRYGAHGIMLHELQHAVQDLEGFAKGGAPTPALTNVDPVISKLNQDIFQKKLDMNDFWNRTGKGPGTPEYDAMHS